MDIYEFYSRRKRVIIRPTCIINTISCVLNVMLIQATTDLVRRAIQPYKSDDT